MTNNIVLFTYNSQRYIISFKARQINMLQFQKIVYIDPGTWNQCLLLFFILPRLCPFISSKKKKELSFD